MFENFFGLREDPFNVNPDPRYLYQTPNTQEALACLTYAIQRRKGFVLLTGEVGTGKTTLLNKLLEWLHGEQLATAFIFNPRLDANQFLEFAMADFGIDTDSPKKSQALLRLNQWLLERYRAGGTAVLIVDEAQNLSLEVLEEIRLLTNLETSTEKLLQIVLCGQPELEHMLKQPQLRQLLQRIVLRCRTYPLTLEQTRGYVVERLHIAGADSEPIFTPGAMALVYQYSQGIPRLINLLCEHALITSFAENQKLVSERTIVAVAHEFELDTARPVEKLGSGGENKCSSAGEALQKRETSFMARAGAAEERLTESVLGCGSAGGARRGAGGGLPGTDRGQSAGFPGEGREASGGSGEDRPGPGGRWSQQFQKHAEAADVEVETTKQVAEQPFRQSTTWRGYLHGVASLLARARRIPAQIQTRKWIFSRESTRVAVEIPVTLSGIGEGRRIFREVTHTIDVSRRGAKIATSNFLAVGTHLWFESLSMEKPTVARVVRHSVPSHPHCTWEICVTLPEVDGPHSVWGIRSPPEDWKTGGGEPIGAKRLERIFASGWAARFESISKVAAPPTGSDKGKESQLPGN